MVSRMKICRFKRFSNWENIIIIEETVIGINTTIIYDHYMFNYCFIKKNPTPSPGSSQGLPSSEQLQRLGVPIRTKQPDQKDT